MPAPAHPKIYHIVHADHLASIVADGHLWSEATLLAKGRPGTGIGMGRIKSRRLHELQLSSHPGLFVGQCVPFYFCPRSIMLFLIHCRNHEELTYRGGQGPIVHLEGDLRAAVAWAETQKRRWAFSLSNAGAYYFEDRCNLDELGASIGPPSPHTAGPASAFPVSSKKGSRRNFWSNNPSRGILLNESVFFREVLRNKSAPRCKVRRIDRQSKSARTGIIEGQHHDQVRHWRYPRSRR